MELMQSSSDASVQPGTVDLKLLVNQLLAELLPARRLESLVIENTVPAGLMLATDTDRVATVLRNIFSTVATYTEESCFRISTKLYGNVVLVQVRDHSGLNICSVESSLSATQPIAEKIGGYIGITSHWEKATTIVFSFPNLPLAA